MKAATFLNVFAAAAVLAALAACSGSTDGVAPADAGGEADGLANLNIAQPQPVHHQVQLLQNNSFEEEVGGMVRSWRPDPGDPQWKTSGGRKGNAYVLRPPAGGRAQLEQAFGLHPSVTGLTLKAQADVRCVAPGAVVLEVEFDCDGQKKRLVRENTVTDNWESLVIRTKLPKLAKPDSITFRLAAYNTVDVALVDEAAAMMTDEPPDLLDVELLANGSFERAIQGQVEAWDVLPRSVGSIETGEAAAGKIMFKLAPRPQGGYSTLQQVANLPSGSGGLKANAQVKIKGAAAKKVAFALVSIAEGGEEKTIASAENSGGDGWETVALSAAIPDENPPDRLLFRVSLRPGAQAPILVDGASLTLTR